MLQPTYKLTNTTKTKGALQHGAWGASHVRGRRAKREKRGEERRALKMVQAFALLLLLLCSLPSPRPASRVLSRRRHSFIPRPTFS